MRRVWWQFAVLLLVLMPISAVQAQATVQLQTDVGFDGVFRPDAWLPLRISVQNTGNALTGSLIVRPETSGRALSNAYSTPIDLPANASKTTFLLIRARDFARQLVLELVSAEGERYTQETLTLAPVGARDRLMVVVSDATAASIPLADVAPAGQKTFQARWTPAQLPAESGALEAVDVLLLHNMSEDALTRAQTEALIAWVSAGGHLIAIGGANWQGTNSAIGETLPLQPASTITLDNVAALAGWANLTDTLDGQVVVTTGSIRDDAQVLASAGETPLLLRRALGDGVVDFLALDPTQAPLRGWAKLSDFWFALIASVPIPNSWSRGIIEASRAADAIALLPNEQLLPPVSTLIAFILAYIGVVGPLNYLILTRLKRQEWAWVTIPLCIVVFSLVATSVGFSLRGDEIIVSRIRVIQAWSSTDRAQEHSIVGLLAPRRNTFDLTPQDARLIYPLPSIGQSSENLQTAAELIESGGFSAQDISVEGGIYSNFASTRTVAKPLVSGQLTRLTQADSTQTFQGSLVNDSDQMLQQPLLLTRGGSLQLPDLAAGALLTIDAGTLTLASFQGVPIPSQMENSSSLVRGALILGRAQAGINDIGTASLALPLLPDNPDAVTLRQSLRRQAFLQAFIRDQYNSAALGDRVYLLAWTNDIPRDLTITPGAWRSVDDTLLIVQLDVRAAPIPATQTITISADRFLWTFLERIIGTDEGSLASRAGLLDANRAGIDDILLNPDEGFVVQFTPLTDARLQQVDTLNIALERGGGFSNQLQLALWNWAAQTWEEQNLRLQEFTLEQPAAYLGTHGEVRLRLISTYPNGTSRVRDLRVTMTGHH